MTKAKESTEIVAATKAPNAVLAMIDFDDSNGFEGADGSAYAIPFIQVLQKMSPLVDEDNPKYVPGAKPGMLYNTVSQKLVDGKTGQIIIPCSYKRSFVQWGGREGDGGFKGEFTPEQMREMMNDQMKVREIEGRLYKPDENGSVNEKKSDYYADTRSHFVLVIDPETGEVGQAIIALSSSQTKASKMLMTMLQQKKIDTPQGKRMPPTFANMVRLTTTKLSNDKGDWSSAKFDLEGLVTDPSIFAEAKAFHNAVKVGEAKADYAKAEHESAGNAVNNSPVEAEGF